VLGNRVITGTRTGNISVLTAGTRGVRYRIRTESPIVGRITTSPPTQVLAMTAVGHVYSFDIRDGHMLWKFATGEESREPATVIGKSVFVLSKREGVFCLATDTGIPRWTSANARRFVTATDHRVYLETQTGSVDVRDIASGHLLGTIPTRNTDHIFSNAVTDRIYVASAGGVIQCLHSLDARWPTVHAHEAASATAETSKSDASIAGSSSTTPAPPSAKPTNPFGPDAGAAGAGKGAAKPDENPFGPPPDTKTKPKKDSGKATGNPFG